jgi:hypothetical protein
MEEIKTDEQIKSDVVEEVKKLPIKEIKKVEEIIKQEETIIPVRPQPVYDLLTYLDLKQVPKNSRLYYFKKFGQKSSLNTIGDWDQITS